MAQKSNVNWTDGEIELLLEITLDYKNEKSAERLEWDGIRNRYDDITERFQKAYEKKAPNDPNFPHVSDFSMFTKAIVIAKTKRMKQNYKAAKDAKNKSGHGRVMFKFIDLCDEIWGVLLQ